MEHRGATLGLQGGRAKGSGENIVRTWSPSPQLWWPKPSWVLGVYAEVATAQEIWEFVEIELDSED